MPRDLNTIDALSGLMAERLRAIPFEDGPHHRGVLLCGAAEGKRSSPAASGACYSVLDGVPRFVPFDRLPCDGLDGIDPVALSRRLEGVQAFDFGAGEPLTQWHAGAMPDSPIGLGADPDLFAGIGWGTPWRWDSLLSDISSAIAGDDPARIKLPFPGIAFPEARRRCEPTVDEARRRFLDALPAEVRGAMAFMCRTLPIYDPRVLGVLLRDGGGPAQEFARRHPLLAMRSLVDPEVAHRACAGDPDGALALSLRPELVGNWVLDHWRRHRKSADAVDGSRRGNPVDDAIDCFGFIPREQLPMSPSAFAACVDACNMAQQMSPLSFHGRHGPGLAEALPKVKGRWDRAVAETARIAPDLVEVGSHYGVAEASWMAFDSFRHDLVRPALELTKRTRPGDCVDLAEGGGPFAGFAVLTKGMGIPDRARMLGAYMRAKPAIAAVHRTLIPTGAVSAEIPDIPWIRLHEVEVRPVSIHAGACYGATLPPSPPEGTLPLTIHVPAEAPDGFVRMRVLVRRGDGEPASRYSYADGGTDPGMGGTCPHPGEEGVLRAIAAWVGEADAKGLGRWLVAATGMEAAITDLTDRLAPQYEERLAAMLKAWRPALPRRFRTLGVGAFAEAIAREIGAGPGAA